MDKGVAKITIAIIALYILLAPFLVISAMEEKLHNLVSDLPNRKVAVVFGAGVKPDGQPSHMLEDRLLSAIELYEKGKVDYILVSGDNRWDHYNEPQAMADYLIKNGVPTQYIHMDFAGRRSYDTCIRAKTLWNVDEAILISQQYHLYRSLLVCNTLGVKSDGYSASRRKYTSQTRNRIREFLAIHKSIIDLYIKPPRYISGEFETDLLK